MVAGANQFQQEVVGNLRPDSSLSYKTAAGVFLIFEEGGTARFVITSEAWTEEAVIT